MSTRDRNQVTIIGAGFGGLIQPVEPLKPVVPASAPAALRLS